MHRRDLFLIPLISLLTVLVLIGGSELAARQLFEKGGKEGCGQWDGLHGTKLTGNCDARAKSPEGPWVDYHFNACGYRTNEACGERPPGHLRIALLGASTAQGYKVPYEQAFAPRAAQELTRQCQQPVEIQNMGVAGYRVIDHYWRMDEALAMKPDAVVLVLSAYELVDVTDPATLARRKSPELLRRTRNETAGTRARADLIVQLDALVADSRAVLAAQHYLYQDRSRYVSLFLMHRDKADYLRTPLSAAWEKRLADLELMLGEMAEKSRAQGVPLVVLFGPQRIQAALLDQALRPQGVDPTLIGRRMADLARRTGVTLVDVLADMGDLPHPEQLFYPVDGHMTGDGHAVLSRSLVQQLTRQQVGAFGRCAPLGRAGARP